jgi:hypothetical protein
MTLVVKSVRFRITVKPPYKDTGYKDILTYKDTFLGPAGINFTVLHTSL